MYYFFWYLYILRLRFTTAKSNADGFNVEAIIYTKSLSWSLCFLELSFQTVDPRSLWPCLYGLSVLFTNHFSLSKGETLRLLQNGPLYTIITTILLHLSSLELLFQIPIPNISCRHHRVGCNIASWVLTLLPPSTHWFSTFTYFSHLQIKCWFVFPHLLT